MTAGTDRKKDCEARLRALVGVNEPVVAAGTAEELAELGPELGSGGGWTFIVLTPGRLLFANWGSPQKPHEEIRLDDVEQWSSGEQYNCQAVVLTHPPVTRSQRIPARRILWFQWGNAVRQVSRTTTIFRFSRPDTKVAKALRAALEARAVPHHPLHFEETSREERTRDSHLVLDAEPNDS